MYCYKDDSSRQPETKKSSGRPDAVDTTPKPCQYFIHYIIIYDVYGVDDFIYKQTLMEEYIYSAWRKTTLMKALRIMTQILKCFKNYARTFNIYN